MVEAPTRVQAKVENLEVNPYKFASTVAHFKTCSKGTYAFLGINETQVNFLQSQIGQLRAIEHIVETFTLEHPKLENL